MCIALGIELIVPDKYLRRRILGMRKGLQMPNVSSPENARSLPTRGISNMRASLCLRIFQNIYAIAKEVRIDWKGADWPGGRSMAPAEGVARGREDTLPPHAGSRAGRRRNKIKAGRLAAYVQQIK